MDSRRLKHHIIIIKIILKKPPNLIDGFRVFLINLLGFQNIQKKI